MLGSRRCFVKASCFALVVNPAAAYARRAEPRGIAITIGLNKIDKSHYGTDGTLRGCINDAKAIRSLAQLEGFEAPESLIDEKATRTNVIAAIDGAAQSLGPGDVFLIQYSGHGASVPDKNGDEADGKDETWCLYDGMLIDDELARLWTKFKPGVRILILSDSCHSGTVAKGNAFRGAVSAGDLGGSGGSRGGAENNELSSAPVFRYLPDEISFKAFREHKALYDPLAKQPAVNEDDIKATVLLISACQDNQLSADLLTNGLFTAELLRVWSGGKFKGSYRDFHRAIMQGLPQTQSPNFYPIGAIDPRFWRQKPFTIVPPTS